MPASECLAAVLVLALVASPLAVPVIPREDPESTTAIPQVPGAGIPGPTLDRTPAPGPSSVPANRPIVVAPGDQTQPDLEWPLLVWTDSGTQPSQVRLLNLDNHTGLPVWPSAGEQQIPMIRDGVIAFSDSPGSPPCYDPCIRIIDTESGQRWSYEDIMAGPEVATTDEFFVHWGPSYSALGRYEIDARYISNGTFTYRDGPGRPYDAIAFGGPVASDDWVVLSARPYYDGYCTPPYPDACVVELVRFFPANGTIVPFTHSIDTYHLAPLFWRQYCLRDFTAEGNPGISGSTIFWQDNRNSPFEFPPMGEPCTAGVSLWDVYSYDVDTGLESPVLTDPWNETQPEADGGLLVWADDRNGNWDIYAMNLTSGREMRITDNPRDQRNPTVSRGCIVWEDNRSGTWDLYGACLSSNSPPRIDSWFVPPTVEGRPVLFTVNASDPEGDSLTYAFDFESDGTIDATSAGNTATWTYGDDFRENATVYVSDWQSTVEQKIPVLVEDVAPSVVPLTAFRVTASDPGSDDLTFIWDFGDHGACVVIVYNNGIGPDPYPSTDVHPITATVSAYHFFARPGPHTVTITVRDDDGGETTVIVDVDVPGPLFQR